MTQLSARQLTLAYGDRTVVESLDVDVLEGKVTMIVGANASGKSTLLRGLARLLRPADGVVTLDGVPLAEIPAKHVAQRIGVLPQSPVAPDGITVADLVSRGRHPHQGWFRRWSEADEFAVARALDATDTAQLAHRPIAELSGGQRQRVWVAMALAQETDLLLLDEPTTYLDVHHQVELLDLLVDLNKSRGTTIVVVLHDLNLAFRYADHLIALRNGRIAAAGDPTAVVTKELISEVFSLPCEVVDDPISGGPLVVPIGRHRAMEVAQ